MQVVKHPHPREVSELPVHGHRVAASAAPLPEGNVSSESTHAARPFAAGNTPHAGDVVGPGIRIRHRHPTRPSCLRVLFRHASERTGRVFSVPMMTRIYF